MMCTNSQVHSGPMVVFACLYITLPHHDIFQAVDSRGGAILVLLDLSAAFDTIDHKKLISTLETYCGIKGDLLKWFIIFKRPCPICTNRIYFLSITKSVVWCSSRLCPGASAFHNLHPPSWQNYSEAWVNVPSIC